MNKSRLFRLFVGWMLGTSSTFLSSSSTFLSSMGHDALQTIRANFRPKNQISHTKASIILLQNDNIDGWIHFHTIKEIYTETKNDMKMKKMWRELVVIFYKQFTDCSCNQNYNDNFLWFNPSMALIPSCTRFVDRVHWLGLNWKVNN